MAVYKSQFNNVIFNPHGYYSYDTFKHYKLYV